MYSCCPFGLDSNFWVSTVCFNFFNEKLQKAALNLIQKLIRIIIRKFPFQREQTKTIGAILFSSQKTHYGVSNDIFGRPSDLLISYCFLFLDGRDNSQWDVGTF